MLQPGRRRQRAWSATNPGNIAIREEVVRHTLAVCATELAGSAPILDCGCGTGWWLERLAIEGIDRERLHGIDVAPERVDAAAGRVPGTTIVQGDLRALPYAGASFGLLTAFNVLSSIAPRAARRRALAEMRRVLAPGGLAIFWEPRVPTPNSATRLVTLGELSRLGPVAAVRPVTLVPTIARRVNDDMYTRLASRQMLRTHRLAVVRRDG